MIDNGELTPAAMSTFNGIDASTGDYATPPMSSSQIAKLALSELLHVEERFELRRQWQKVSDAHLAPTARVDPNDLAQAGWGIIFGPEVRGEVKDALRPLLELRQHQSGDLYRTFEGPAAFREGDTKTSFLARSRAAQGPSNPRKVPYYLLLVGSPDTLPFKFQYQLDIQYAVGRLDFDTAAEYAHYAATAVAAEKKEIQRSRKVTFFGVRNDNDPATQLSADHLVSPIVNSLRQGEDNWKVDALLGNECTRAALLDLLTDATAPTLLFSASHGLRESAANEHQYARQGALLCQDWPGPLRHRGPIPENFYVGADHILESARFPGLISFFFACYGAGTPRMDDFAHTSLGPQQQIAPSAFVAALPKKLLGRRDGALAVIGHVERVWSCSFFSGQAGRQVEVFESAIRSLLAGQRVGAAMEWFNMRYAELASDLALAVEERRGRPLGANAALDEELAVLWTTSNDARSYVVLGDPAVRLAVAHV